MQSLWYVMQDSFCFFLTWIMKCLDGYIVLVPLVDWRFWMLSLRLAVGLN